jgi:phage terminase small subunit
MSGKEKKLTPKQERFVEEYLVDLNASAAARRAGYSARSANRIGPELLGKTCICEAIEKAKAKRSARTGITQDDVVKELWHFYRVNSVLIEKYGFAGRDKDVNGDDAWKMVDATAAGKALDMLMKHFGGYDADNRREVGGSIQFVWGDKE